MIFLTIHIIQLKVLEYLLLSLLKLKWWLLKFEESIQEKKQGYNAKRLIVLTLQVLIEKALEIYNLIWRFRCTNIVFTDCNYMFSYKKCTTNYMSVFRNLVPLQYTYFSFNIRDHWRSLLCYGGRKRICRSSIIYLFLELWQRRL